MTGEQATLFGARRRRGVSRAQLDRTLLAWRRAGILAGDENAAMRSALRDMASAVDDAREAKRHWADLGEPGRGVKTYGDLSRAYLDALRACAEGTGQGDAIDDLLAAFSDAGAPVRDDT
jgi:hypothetical protein